MSPPMLGRYQTWVAWQWGQSTVVETGARNM